MYRKFFSLLSLMLVLAGAFVLCPSLLNPTLTRTMISRSVQESANGVYIVQMIHAPAVAYEGDIQGLAKTKPNDGEKLDSNNPDVQEYVEHLEGEHDEALQQAGGEKLYDYGYTFNGFAAELTVQQANKLLKVDGVMQVTPDTMYSIDTSSTPNFLGLDAKKGIWSQLGGSDEAGQGVVIGIIDSGVWPESLKLCR